MNSTGKIRTLACISMTVVSCLAVLCASAFAHAGSNGVEAIGQARRSPGPQIERRHAVAGGQRSQKASRHHHGHHGGRSRGGGSETSTGSSDGGNAGATGGSSTGSGKKDPAGSTKPTTPVTEPPKTTPPTTTPPVATPPVTTPPVTTPPPTETPPVAPTQTTHCFASPHLCGFPDSTNTGVPGGTTLKPSGSVTVTRPGTVISGLAVTGTIEVLADNVTIEDTRVTQNTTCGTRSTCGNFAIRINEGVDGTTIRNVETASAPGDTCEHDIRNTGGTLTIEGAYLHACDSNVYAVGPTTLKNSYGIGELAISEDHVENIYFNETSFSAIHDTLVNPVEQTAVIFGNSGGGYDVTNCSNQLTVLESLIAGGGYSLYPCAHAAQAGTSTLNVQGNHFARCVSKEGYEPDGGTHPCTGGADSSGYYPKSGSYGIATNYFEGVGTWRGNVWDDNLAKACITGSSTGCE